LWSADHTLRNAAIDNRRPDEAGTSETSALYTAHAVTPHKRIAFTGAAVKTSSTSLFISHFCLMNSSSAICLLSFPLSLFVRLFFPFITSPGFLFATKQADLSTFLPVRAYNSIQTDSHHFSPCSTHTLPAVQYHLQFQDRY